LSNDTFVREFVARNKPVVITDALAKWPALYKWNPRSFFTHRDETVTVNFSPDGWGDSLVEVAEVEIGEEGDRDLAQVFVKPQEVDMPLGAAAALIAGGCEQTSAAFKALPLGVPYLSWQNDSLRRQTPALLADLRPFPFAPWGNAHSSGEDAGMGAEAVNLWLGDERSTSSIHKDHFENLYAVVRGEKVFTLLPPCDVLWLYERQYATGTFRFGSRAAGAGVEPEVGSAAAASGCSGELPRATAPEGDADPPGWSIHLDLEATVSTVAHGAVETGGAANVTSGEVGGSAHATACGAAASAAGIVRVGDQRRAVLSECSMMARRASSISSTACTRPRWLYRPAPLGSLGGTTSKAVSEGRTSLRHLLSQCSQVPWISVNPSLPRPELERRFPLYTRYATPYTVRVKAGETLYLPSLWYHQVTQSELTLAVNHWWDMDYCGPGWAYYNMCRGLAPAVQASSGPGGM
jgi:jumonji domain-containing protein 7